MPSTREASRFLRFRSSYGNWRNKISCTRRSNNCRVLSWTKLNRCTEASSLTIASPDSQKESTRYTRSSSTQHISTCSAHRKVAALDSTSNSWWTKLKPKRKTTLVVPYNEDSRGSGMLSLKCTNGTLILFTDIWVRSELTSGQTGSTFNYLAYIDLINSLDMRLLTYSFMT